MKQGKLGMIDVRDIVDVAAKVLTEDGHEGKTYALTGPASISYHDVAAGLPKAMVPKAGTPDIVMCWRGRLVGIELKAGRGRMSPAQRETHDAITLAGGVVTEAPPARAGGPTASWHRCAS